MVSRRDRARVPDRAVTAVSVAAGAHGLSERALLGLLASLTAVGAVTLNIYLPARPDAQAQLHASLASTGLTVSLAGVAFACGLLAYGPWSDRYGRRPVILFGLSLFILGTTLSMLAGSMTMLIVARVVQGFGSAAGVTIGRAVVRDLFPPERMARSLAYLTMVVAVANAVAPSVGGLLTELLHWRAVFGALLIASAAVLYATLRYLPETLVRAPGAWRGPGAVATLAQLATMPAFMTCALQSSVVYATFLVFASYMPYVMQSAFGGTPSGYGLWYLLIAGGYFLGNFAVTRYAARYGLRRLFRTGATIQCAAAALALLLAVLHVWRPIAVFGPWMVLAFGQGLILPNVTAAAVSLAPWAAGAAAGLLGFVQQLVASATVQALAGVPTDSPVPISLFIAAAAAVGLASALTSNAGIPAHVAVRG